MSSLATGRSEDFVKVEHVYDLIDFPEIAVRPLAFRPLLKTFAEHGFRYAELFGGLLLRKDQQLGDVDEV